MTEAAEVAPTFVVDITAIWDTKMKAIRAFASQFTPAPGETVSLPFDRFQQAVELTARRHGQRIGVDVRRGLRDPGAAARGRPAVAGRSSIWEGA